MHAADRRAENGRPGRTGRFGPTTPPIRYKLHEGSTAFHALQDTFTEEDPRTGIAHTEYRVAPEADQHDPEGRAGWVMGVDSRYPLHRKGPGQKIAAADLGLRYVGTGLGRRAIKPPGTSTPGPLGAGPVRG